MHGFHLLFLISADWGAESTVDLATSVPTLLQQEAWLELGRLQPWGGGRGRRSLIHKGLILPMGLAGGYQLAPISFLFVLVPWVPILMETLAMET